MKRVLIGISGGVDSSVAAALLKEQGYEVIGITFVFTNEFDSTDAINVCEKLNIEHHIIDYKEIFKRTIIDTFINDYKRGITPNPCITCNKEVKFNFLYQNMTKFNCDFIATGHYGKIYNGRLYISEDLNKDQTYFLSQLTKEQLSKLLLPLEGITKDKVREIAREYALINADRKDSTDVCFITSNFKDYMNQNIKDTSGDVIDVDSKQKVGTHNGLSHYTIGQRKGLNIGGSSSRMYVVGKDILTNRLYVAVGDDSSHLVSTSCLVTNFNLIGDKVYKATARFRYRQPLTEITIEYLDNNDILVHYPNGVKAVTPGQACVIYLDNECIGGGIIKEVK